MIYFDLEVEKKLFIKALHNCGWVAVLESP